MLSTTRHHISIAALSAVIVLLSCPTAQATQTITLTNTPNYYAGESVGPYTANVTGVAGSLLVYCLDGTKTTYGSSTGTLYAFNSLPASQSAFTQKEEEAAFLAAYSLTLDPTHTTNLTTVEGPISLAIWSIMGTLPSNLTLTPAQTAAVNSYVTLAQTVVTNNPTVFAANSTFMKTVSIWIPDSWPASNQRFVTVGTLPPGVVPEPGTVVFLGTGVILLAIGKIRRRK